MADLKDNLWKALDALRDSPEDPLDFDQIQEAVDQWKRVRQELELEDAINAAADYINDAFYYAVKDYGMKDERQLELARNNAMDYVREAVKSAMNLEPTGKHSATGQDKPDGESSVRALKYDITGGSTGVSSDLDYETIVKGVMDSLK